MTISKTKSSFYRRLYVAYLIDSGIASVPEIMAATGMPRRTAQDTIAALEELDIVCEFEQREGARNHQGGYVIRDWGAVRREWVVEQHRRIAAALEYPACSAARNSSACCAINPTRRAFQWWKRNFRIARRVPPGYPS